MSLVRRKNGYFQQWCNCKPLPEPTYHVWGLHIYCIFLEDQLYFLEASVYTSETWRATSLTPRWGNTSNTMWPGLRPTSVPSGTLIHPAIWLQQTWAENWRVCATFFFLGGGAGSVNGCILHSDGYLRRITGCMLCAPTNPTDHIRLMISYVTG